VPKNSYEKATTVEKKQPRKSHASGKKNSHEKATEVPQNIHESATK